MAQLSHTAEQQERRRTFVQVNVIHLPVTCGTSYHHCTTMAGNITPLMFIQPCHEKEGRCAYSSVINTIAASRERRGDLSETEREKLVTREYNPLMFTQQYTNKSGGTRTAASRQECAYGSIIKRERRHASDARVSQQNKKNAFLHGYTHKTYHVPVICYIPTIYYPSYLVPCPGIL